MNYAGAATVELLKQHGFHSAAAQLSAPDSVPCCDGAKLSTVLSRDAERRPVRLGAQLHAQEPAPGYEESYAALWQWLSELQPPLREELLSLAFPVLLHCFVGLAGREQLEAAKRLLTTQADSVASAEEKPLVDALGALGSPGEVASHPLVSRLLATRVPWVGSTDAFKCLSEFLIEKRRCSACRAAAALNLRAVWAALLAARGALWGKRALPRVP